VLSYFRSQHDNQSWVGAMTTILDACALTVARIEEGPERTARLTFAMASHAVKDLCAVFHLEPAFPLSDRLPVEERQGLESFLTASGFRLRSDEKSLAKLTAMRAMYEPYAHALAVYLLMPLPSWIPPEGARDNWQRTA
jgi:hypothetical protein